MNEQIVPASSPVTADDVRAAVGQARHDAVKTACEASLWAPRIAKVLEAGLEGLYVKVSISGGVLVQVHAAHESAALEYVGDGLVQLHLDDADDEWASITFDASTEREAVMALAAWAIRQPT